MAEVEVAAGTESAANVLAAARIGGLYTFDALGRQASLRSNGGSGPDIIRWTYASDSDYLGSVSYFRVVP